MLRSYCPNLYTVCEGPCHKCKVFGDCGIPEGAGGARAALNFGTNNSTSKKYGN